MSTPAAHATTARRGLRWAVASVATAALVVSGSGLVVFAQSGAGSQGPVFAPADSAIYIEARLDMPEGQDEALAQFMTAFPGFNDPGTFQMKIDEVLAGVADNEAIEGDILGDVFTGEIGIAMTDLEAAMMEEEPTMIIGMVVADPALAEEMAASLAEGAALEAIEDLEGMEGMEDMPGVEMIGDTTIVSDLSSSVAIHGDWMLLSNDAEQVKIAIDVLDGNAESLADDPDFAAAFARVPSARLGAAYVDMTSFGSMIDMVGSMAGAEAGMELPMDDLATMLPTDMVAYIAAENDRITVEAFVTPAEGTPSVPVGDSELATLFPAETQLYIEVRELGTTIENGLNQVAEMMAVPEGSEPAEGEMGGMSDIDMLLSEDSPFASMLGAPLPQFLDFVADAGVGAGMSSDGLWLGIAGEVTDEDLAATRVQSVISLITLFGGDPAETGITIVPEMVEDVEVTKVMVPLDAMMAESGAPISLGDSISVAVADGYLLLGMGDFVQSAIAGQTESLGASAGYVDALGDDTVNAGLTYVNISSLLAALDPMLSMMSPEWPEIAPYVGGLDRMVAVATADEDVLGSRISIISGQ